MNKNELLRKLRAVAERGVGGERINAERKMKELMEKYGLSEEDFEQETLIDCEFTFHSTREKKLLIQVIYKVLNSEKIYTFVNSMTGRKYKTLIGCEATASQKIEIEFLFDFYKRLYKQEEEFFFVTFIQKHKIFGDPTDDIKDTELSDYDLWKMNMLMKCMKDETPLKQIAEKSITKQ